MVSIRSQSIDSTFRLQVCQQKGIMTVNRRISGGFDAVWDIDAY